MEDNFNESLKPQRLQQATNFEQRNREYLNKLSEQSRQSKLKQQQLESDPTKQLERNFSVFNSGANALKGTSRSRSNPKNIQKWDPQQSQQPRGQSQQPDLSAEPREPDAGVQNSTLEPYDLNPVFAAARNQRLTPNVYQSPLDLTCSVAVGVNNQFYSLRLSPARPEHPEQPNYLNYPSYLNSPDYLDYPSQLDHSNQFSRLDYPEQRPELGYQSQAVQFAPIDSLFMVDVEGNEIPVERAITDGISGFMPVVERVDDAGAADASEAPEQVDLGGLEQADFPEVPLLAPNPTKTSGARKLSSSQNTEFGETLPEVNASDTQNNYSSYKMVSLSTEQNDGLSPAQIPESLLQLMMAIDYLPDQFPKRETTQMILTDYQYYYQRDSFCRPPAAGQAQNEADEGKTAAKHAEEQDAAQDKQKTLKPAQERPKSSLYERSLQLQESLTLKGMDSLKLAQQLQLMSPDERQFLLRQIIEIEQDQETRRPKIKDINKPPSRIHSERPKMLSPKQINHPAYKQDFQSAQPPQIIRGAYESVTPAPDLTVSKLAKPQLLAMIIQIVSCYDTADASGTMLPQLLSSDKSPIFTAFADSQGAETIYAQLSSQRCIVPQFPTADRPIYIFTTFSETAKYVLQQDQRKGRQRVAMPKEFSARVFQLEVADGAGLQETVKPFVERGEFLVPSACKLECDALLPITNNQLQSNELVFKCTSKRPMTPQRQKIPRPNNQYDVVEIHLLSSVGGVQVGIGQVQLLNLDNEPVSGAVISANNWAKSPETLMLPKQQFVSKYETAIVYIQAKKGEAHTLIVHNSATDAFQCRDFTVKFNCKLVRQGQMSPLQPTEVRLCDQPAQPPAAPSAAQLAAPLAAQLVAQLVAQPAAQPAAVLTNSRTNNVKSAIASPEGRLFASPSSQMLASSMSKSRASLSSNKYKVASWADLIITLVFLAPWDDAAASFALGNALLRTDKNELLRPRTLCLIGPRFDFDVRGDRVAQNINVALAEHTDLSLPLITANRWAKLQRTDCCRAQICFETPRADAEYAVCLLLNNNVADQAGSLRYCMFAFNNVLQQPLPGVQVQLSPLSAAQYIARPPRVEKAIQQDLLQKTEHFQAFPLRQQLSKGASDLQRLAQQSDDMYQYVQTKFALDPAKSSRNPLQLNLLHTKISGQSVTYATLFQPAGVALRIDVLSYYRESGAFGFEFVQLLTNSNQIVDYAQRNVFIYSSLQNHKVVAEQDASVSDSQAPADNIARQMPWTVQCSNLHARYECGYQSERVLCSLCFRFEEKQEISAVQFIANNVAEMTVSMNGRLLVECVANDVPDIQIVSFCKAKTLQLPVRLQ